MSQNFTDDCFAGTHVAQTDAQNMENNFAALKSSFSGSSAPSNPVPGMPWFDTGDSLIKTRNTGDTAWLAFLTGDTSQKLWIYRNDTVEGWAIDSGVTDRVIAIKGGSNAYNVSGGSTAGTWTQPNHTHTLGNHTHNLTGTGGASLSATGTIVCITSSNTLKLNAGSGSDSAASTATNEPSPNTSGNGTTPNTYRPAAAVGTLQYPNIT